MEDSLIAKDSARIRRQQISLNYVDCRPKEVFIDKGKAGHANNYTTTQNDATTITSTLANSNIPSAPLPKPSHSIQSVYIPHLTSASKFYLQLASREDELNRMSERIAEATMTAEDVSTKDLAVNMPCLAIFEEAWYRGIIIEREEKTPGEGGDGRDSPTQNRVSPREKRLDALDIFFPDYGNVVSVSTAGNKIKRIPSALISTPAFAIEACLGRKCGEWRASITPLFNDILEEHEYACEAKFAKVVKEGGACSVQLIVKGHDVVHKLYAKIYEKWDDRWVCDSNGSARGEEPPKSEGEVFLIASIQSEEGADPQFKEDRQFWPQNRPRSNPPHEPYGNSRIAGCSNAPGMDVGGKKLQLHEETSDATPVTEPMENWSDSEEKGKFVENLDYNKRKKGQSLKEFRYEIEGDMERYSDIPNMVRQEGANVPNPAKEREEVRRFQRGLRTKHGKKDRSLKRHMKLHLHEDQDFTWEKAFDVATRWETSYGTECGSKSDGTDKFDEINVIESGMSILELKMKVARLADQVRANTRDIESVKKEQERMSVKTEKLDIRIDEGFEHIFERMDELHFVGNHYHL